MPQRPSPPKTKRPHVVHVCLSHEELEAVDSLARRDGTSRSDAIRLMLREAMRSRAA